MYTLVTKKILPPKALKPASSRLLRAQNTSSAPTGSSQIIKKINFVL